MPNTREKLIELLDDALQSVDWDSNDYPYTDKAAELLIANGVTVQDDMKEMIGRGLDNIYWKMYGANKEFNERMAGYNPSAFCAGFEYAIQLAKGLLTQLSQPPKGE